VLPAFAAAATLTVNTTADTDTPDDGVCSLREAIAAVNSAPTGSDCGATTAGANTIVLPASSSPYELTIPTTGTDDNTSGDLDLSAPGPVTISGAGTNATTISAATLGNRILHVLSGAVTIENLTLTGGHAPNGADGQPGTVDVHDISHNPTHPGNGFNGGAIFNGGTLTLDHVVVAHNFAGNGGKGGDGETLVAGTSGGAGGAGGGIDNVGSLTLTDVTVSDNQAGNGGIGGAGGAGGTGGEGGTGGCCGDGGGVFSAGTSLTVESSTFTGNVAGTGGSGGRGGDADPSDGGEPGDGGSGAGGSSGGAIALEGGSMTVRDSTFTANQGGLGGNGGNPGSGGGFAEGPPPGNGGDAGDGSAGGALFIHGATASLSSVTISANTPGAAGAAAAAGGTGASAGSPGTPAFAGGVDAAAGSTVTLENTLLALDPDGNCAGTIGNAGGNLSFGDGTCPAGFAGGDPKLGALADNGGPTETMDLGPGSPAIGAGGDCPGTDQRGVARRSGTACDIGAYQVTPPAVSALAATGVTTDGATLTASVTPNAGAASVTFEYGTTTADGSQVSVAAGGGIAPSPIQTTISHLKRGTVYHFRVLASSSDGSTTSADAAFTTKGTGPRPQLGRIHVAPGRFHAAPGRHKQKTGAKLTYTDSLAAKTTFVVVRLLPGIKHRGRCVVRRRGAHGSKCTRQVRAGTFSHTDVAGQNRVSFKGRLKNEKLPKGRYLVRATPAIAGSAGAPVTFKFTII
jgi:CSLREA domain-containing protein